MKATQLAGYELQRKRLASEAERLANQRLEEDKAATARAKAKKLEETKKQYSERRAATGRPSPPVTNKPFVFFGGSSLTVEGEAKGRESSSKALLDIPQVTRWKQNPDGSITGYIYKSKNFKDGTRVTTTPVAKGAKAGTVVKTRSGTQYSLK